jgi:hypothetical protein
MLQPLRAAAIAHPEMHKRFEVYQRRIGLIRSRSRTHHDQRRRGTRGRRLRMLQPRFTPLHKPADEPQQQR